MTVARKAVIISVDAAAIHSRTVNRNMLHQTYSGPVRVTEVFYILVNLSYPYINQPISRSDWKCAECGSGEVEVEDVKHLLMKCEAWDREREELMEKMKSLSSRI